MPYENCSYQLLRDETENEESEDKVNKQFNKKRDFIKKTCYTVTIVIFFILLVTYQYIIYNFNSVSFEEDYQDYLITSETKYLVTNKKCRIPSVDHMNPEVKKYYRPEKYMSCRKKELLTYISKDNNSFTLHIKTHLLSNYSKEDITCCYSYVERANKEDPDCCIKILPCHPFKVNVTLSKSIVMVTCKSTKSKKEVYKNVHATIDVKEEVENKILSFNSTKKPLSILFIGIDSVSRLHFMRALSKTWDFVKNDSWVEIKGYNKMGDNTFPNLMAIFTGMNESSAYKNCKPKDIGMLDRCNFIWNDYSNNNYITSYAEDSAQINTFNYHKKGFSKPPTDYYFRPYFLAAEKLRIVEKHSLSYCTGPETSGERVLNIAKDFAATFRENPYFGFFWMNSFSHNHINSASTMDEKVRDTLEDIVYSGSVNNSVIVFLSDHGMRFGDFRHTHTGWYEERLPFLYFRLPDWFQNEFPEEYQNLKDNADKLTSPYDLYITLQDMLTLSGLNFTAKPSEGCPNCKSLFSKIPNDRDCSDVGVSNHWCTCTAFTSISVESEIVNNTLKLTLDYIWNDILKQNSKCRQYTPKKIFYTKVSKPVWFNNVSNLIVGFEAEPKADFEATISFNDKNFDILKLEGDISRLDMYAGHSKCMNDSVLKKYCYCR